MKALFQSARQGKPATAALALPLLACAALLLASCATYEYRAVPVRPISSYPGQASVGGAQIGALAFYDSRVLADNFGFDLKKAGVVPVQVMISNHSGSTVTVLEGARMEDVNGNQWELLPSEIVFHRINDYTEGSLDGRAGVRRTLTWGLAGAIVGAAVGAVGGTNIGEAAAKGAAVGGAAGAASSLMGAGTEQDTSEDVVRDFSARTMEHRSVQPGTEVSGLLYFPAEAAQPRRLILPLSAGGYSHTATLNL
jgi:hypothetical protein